MAKTPVESEKKRQLAAMPPALREGVADFVEKMGKAYEADILTKYDCGRLIHSWLSDEEAYGEDAVAQVAQYLDLHPTQKQAENILYDMRSFAVTYKRARVKELLAKTGPNGKKLHYNHFRQLCGVKSLKLRAKYENMVLAMGLSVEDLARELKAKDAKTRPSSGGRKPNPPRTPNVGLQQIYELCNSFQNRHTTWEAAIFQKLLDAAPADLDTDLFNRATAAEDSLEKLIASAKEDLEVVRRCKTRIAKVVKVDGGNNNPNRKRTTKKKKKKAASSSASTEKPAVAKKRPPRKGKSVKKRAAVRS